MSSVNDDAKPDREPDDVALLSPRSLLIIVTSVVIALLIGIGAGIAATLTIPTGQNVLWRLLVGLLVGLGTTLATGLSVAAALHGLVGRR